MSMLLPTTPLLPFVQGLMLSASLIIAVGPQNLFLLRHGLKRSHLFPAAAVSTLVDLGLISLGVGGLGAAIAVNERLLMAMSLCGALFLVGYGVRSVRSALRTQRVAEDSAIHPSSISLRGTILSALSFSILNPAAYIDTLLMIGTMSGRFAISERVLFGTGAVTASALWFFTLTYGSSHLSPLFRHTLVWRMLDVISGFIMFALAASLSLGCWSLFLQRYP